MPRNADGRWDTITDEEALQTARGPVVSGFPLQFEWHSGPWQDIFDDQVKLIRADVRRARAEDKLIVYLSCPISARGGGYSGANVDIAKFVERALLQQWGEAFWILNPAQYQLESKAGTGLMERHAIARGIDLPRLRVQSNPQGSPKTPSGGDYMRMWTQVLVDNQDTYGFEEKERDIRNSGRHFDAFYFIGPSDVRRFFTENGVTLTSGIESYFARKYATESDFRDAFTVNQIEWGTTPNTAGAKFRQDWQFMRLQFLRYYGLRASANFSLGSHDEWNILCEINRNRLQGTVAPNQLDGDPGIQLACYFDGNQVDLSATQTNSPRGYAL